MAPGEETPGADAARADAGASRNAEPAGTPRRARTVAGVQGSADGSAGGPVGADAGASPVTAASGAGLTSGPAARLAGGDAAARRAGGPRPGWGERAGWTLAVVGPLAFLAVFFAWPVATLMGRGLAPDGALDLSGFGEVLARERTWRILTQTLTQAVLGTAVCVALGIPGALVLYRRAFPGRDLLRGVVTVPFVLPSSDPGSDSRSRLPRFQSVVRWTSGIFRPSASRWR